MGCKDRTGAKWAFVGWRPRNEEQRRSQVSTEDTKEGMRGDGRKKDKNVFTGKGILQGNFCFTSFSATLLTESLS